MSTRNVVQSASRITLFPALSKRLAVVAILPALALAGCVAVPVGSGPDGNPHWAYYPLGAPIAPMPGAVPPAVTPGGPMPAVLTVRLYPANDLANQTGVLTGQVTNLMSGKGRFQFAYQGEMLVGEATRVSGEARRGIASAYGGRGTFARCEYQMSTPLMGAGTCTFSNGAEYQVHIGS
jgi:hypothetical protein